MKPQIRWWCVVMVAGLLAGCVATSPKATTADVPPEFILSGTPDQMGRSHGEQLGGQIRTLHQQYMKRWITSDAERVMALFAAAAFQSQMSPDHRAELFALAKAANADPQQTVLANCFLDLTGLTACSTITLPASASPDGVARFARNLDFPSFDIADNATVLLVYKPQGKYAFASIGWPGLIGVLSGMNEHGLALANMEVTRDARPPTAMPYALLYRTVLERCRTVNEAIDLLRKTPRQTENNLMLMDATGDRAVAEIYPDHVNVRRTAANEALISTNHRRCDLPDESGRCWRYDELDKTAREQFGRLDAPQLEQALGRVAQGDMTLQSMIFEPSTRVLYLATGKNAPTRSFRRIELSSLFKR